MKIHHLFDVGAVTKQKIFEVRVADGVFPIQIIAFVVDADTQIQIVELFDERIKKSLNSARFPLS